jgi:hypothetical protein
VNWPLVVIGALCLAGFSLGTYAKLRLSYAASTPYYVGGAVCGVIFVAMLLVSARP